MKYKKIFLIAQILIIFIYSLMTIFSIIILPVNVILGFLCILFLPGYNLINLLKPDSDIIKKVGYATFLSLLIGNIPMFFIYVIGYSIVPIGENYGFWFWPEMVIIIIQIINIILILVDLIINKNRIKKDETYNYFELKKEDFNIRTFLIIIGFIVSLTFLCITTCFSDVSDNDYLTVRQDYTWNFTFFYRVPFLFYIFLGSTLISLTLIIFYVKNRYLILFCLSAFIYCLLILPYLQIGNYFGQDTWVLDKRYEIYLHYGFSGYKNYCFFLESYSPLRYTTPLFTSILLINGFGLEIKFALMFLYPLIFIFIPFFFYSVFQQFSEKSDENQKKILLLTILAVTSPLTVKYAHSATSVVIGLFIFYILVIEFYVWTYKHKYQLKHMFFIIILYFFLSITHFEESIYFILIIIFYSIYYIFINIQKAKKNKEIESISKRFLYRNTFLLFILLTIFLLTQEFFGWVFYYLSQFEDVQLLDIVSQSYLSTKITIPLILDGHYQISLFFGGIVFIVSALYFLILYISFFKLTYIFEKLYKKFVDILIKIHNFFKKVISIKIIQITIPIIIIIIMIIFDIFYFPFLQEEGLLILFEIVLSFSYIIFNIFLFIKGIIFYKIQNKKENYFLLSIIACSSLILILTLIGNLYFAFSILNVKYITYFIFFNLIIIQNYYFKDFIKKKTLYLMILIILTLFFGVIYSLKELRFG